jgi:hypothetical protein
LLKNGKIDAALSLLASAASMVPEDAEIQYHHAVGLSAAGRNPEARVVLERLAAKKAPLARRKDVEQLLRTLPP